MKSLLELGAVLSIFTLWLLGIAVAQEKGKITIGMSLDDFRKAYPGVAPTDAKPDGQWARREKLFGLDGSWHYTFKGGKLDWALWDVYVDEITAAHFERCLTAALALIRE